MFVDYIGRMEKASPILNKAGNNLLKITLQDQRYLLLTATYFENLYISNNIKFSTAETLLKRLYGNKLDFLSTERLLYGSLNL
ncbi:hypothetical protein Hanom_Chr07g00667691 [Helianthus anomalus]